MGTRYSVAPAAKAGINAANSAMWELRAAATLRPRIIEVGIFVSVLPTAAPNFVIARSTALGVTPTNIVGLPDDPGEPAPTAGFAAAWGTAPTFSTTGPWARSALLPLTIGAGVIWTFPQGLILPVGTGATSAIVIANLNASGATLGSFQMYMAWEE